MLPNQMHAPKGYDKRRRHHDHVIHIHIIDFAVGYSRDLKMPMPEKCYEEKLED